MPRPSRLILAPAAVAAALAWTGTAAAAITGTPDFTLAPFTKAQAGAGNAVGVTTRWAPVAFAPATGNDHYEVRVTPLPAGSPQTVSAGTATTLGPLFVGDGRPLRVEVGACQQAACDFGAGTALATHETMIDATPPAGTVVIDGGAPATDHRTVSLALDAADPLIDGRPGTSSGVSQFAVDVDDDGTYPCDPSDTSGCARGFAPAASAVLPEGDGLKTVGVTFGDGAREPSVPCTTPLCAGGLGGPILGNASPPATDTILLDTVAPVARLGRVTVTVQRDDAAVFDAAASTDSSPVTPSGVDFPATTWDFADGTPVATGSRVAHAFTRIGTFVGTLRVRDRAGNVSAARSFTVTVDPRAGETIDGFGSVAGVRGSAAFALSQITVSARYVHSRLSGSILLEGVASRPGPLVASIRRTPRGAALLTVRRAVRAGSFTRGMRLPPTLLPGVYRLDVAGPGGTLAGTLTLRPPREGVASSAKVTLRGGPRARFVLAARPIPRLRSKVTVTWAQAGRRLGTVRAGSGRVVTAGLPAGATARAGTLTATLRAGTAVVAVASARVG